MYTTHSLSTEQANQWKVRWTGKATPFWAGLKLNAEIGGTNFFESGYFKKSEL
jgi:hypothetical protein